MKKILLIITIVLLTIACNTTKSIATHKSIVNENYKTLSSFNGDTASYYKYNFIENKDKYIGKSLTVLFDDLEIPIKSTINGGGPYGKVDVFMFSNENRDETSNRIGLSKKGSLYLLTVELTEAYPIKTILEYRKEHNNGEITKDQYPYYSQFTIKNIYF